MITFTEAWTVTRVRIPWYPASKDAPLPLGRNVHHDSRSLAYPWPRDPAAPRAVAMLHARRIPILDQLKIGSCTGNGEIGCIGTDPLFAALPLSAPLLTEDEAVALYSAAEKIDGGTGYPPEDAGSSGLSAALAARNAGLISGFVHCLSLADVIDALQAYPISIGINWYDSFDSPPGSGLLSISPSAQVRGAHEPMLRGVDPIAQEVFGDNSWGEGWGPLLGSFRMSFATLDRLLHEQGDGTVSLPLSVAPPVPVPVPPAPVPAPVPVPVPPAPVTDAADSILWAAEGHWANARHTGSNAQAAQNMRAWAHAKGLL